MSSRVERIAADIQKAKEALTAREASLAAARQEVERLKAERAKELADGGSAVRLRTRVREVEATIEDHELAVGAVRERLGELQPQRDQEAIEAAKAEIAALDPEAQALDGPDGDPETLLATRRAAITLAGAVYAVLIARDSSGHFDLDPRRRAAGLYSGVPETLRPSAFASKPPLPAALQERIDRVLSALPASLGNTAQEAAS